MSPPCTALESEPELPIEYRAEPELITGMGAAMLIDPGTEPEKAPRGTDPPDTVLYGMTGGIGKLAGMELPAADMSAEPCISCPSPPTMTGTSSCCTTVVVLCWVGKRDGSTACGVADSDSFLTSNLAFNLSNCFSCFLFSRFNFLIRCF